MTRVNANLNFKHLSDQLILNELGEITRILDLVEKRIIKNVPFDDIPSKFKLGAGHQKFFFNKCGFILNRYLQLRTEHEKRTGSKYSTEHLKEALRRYSSIKNVRPELCLGYVMDDVDEELILLRLNEKKLTYKRKHTYYGKTI